MQKPIQQSSDINPQIQVPKTVISGISGVLALLIVFVLTLALSFIFQDSLLPYSGYFSELANALAFPIRLGFSLMIVFIFHIFAAAYDIKTKFIPMLLLIYLVFLEFVVRIVESDIGESYLTILRLRSQSEQAIVVATVTAATFLVIKLLIELAHYLRHRDSVKLSKSYLALFVALCMFWLGSLYISVNKLDQLKNDAIAIQLPNTDKISTKMPRDLDVVRQKKLKNTVTKVEYIDEPLIEGQKQSDNLTIYSIEFSTKLEEFCGAANPKSRTPNGIEYSYETAEKNTSIPPLPQNSYQETRLCFIVGQYGFFLSRNNAYGKTSYTRYSHDEVISLFGE